MAAPVARRFPAAPAGVPPKRLRRGPLEEFVGGPSDDFTECVVVAVKPSADPQTDVEREALEVVPGRYWFMFTADEYGSP